MRLRSEFTVLVAGLLMVGFAIYQAARDRSFELFLAGGIVLVLVGLFRHQLRHLKVGPGGVDLAVDEALGGTAGENPVKSQLSEPTQPSDLKLLISTGIPVGWAETLMGTDHIVQVTAVNTGEKPLGVNSLGLSLSDGRYIPVYETMPTDGNTRLPAILNPQQTATVWLDHESLRKTLHDDGTRIKTVLANMADGSIRKEKVPEDWQELGSK